MTAKQVTVKQVSDYEWTVTITYEGTETNARNPGEEADG